MKHYYKEYYNDGSLTVKNKARVRQSKKMHVAKPSMQPVQPSNK